MRSAGEAVPRDQPCLLEHLEMLGDGRLAHGERCGHVEDAGVTLGQAGEDRPPRRVREGPEGPVELCPGELCGGELCGRTWHNHIVI